MLMKSGEVVTPLISRVLVDKSQTEEQYNEDLLTPVTEIPRAILHPEDSLFLDFHGLPIFLIATCHLKITAFAAPHNILYAVSMVICLKILFYFPCNFFFNPLTTQESFCGFPVRY